jgi:hypothetical protein
MSMFSLKVTRELPVGLLLVMCVRRDTVVTPLHTYQVTGWELERKLTSQNGRKSTIPGMGLLQKIKIRFVPVLMSCVSASFNKTAQQNSRYNDSNNNSVECG